MSRRSANYIAIFTATLTASYVAWILITYDAQIPHPSSIAPFPTTSLPTNPRPTPSAASQAELVEQAFSKLETGEFFHTVPETMKVDVPVLIEAGIAKKVTQALLNDLQVKGKVKIRENIRYDPLGVELKLKVDNEEFKVRDITTGVKPIVSGNPEIWMWEVTPLKYGNHSLTILAVVQLKMPKIDRTYTKEIVVFREDRNVEVNLGYSLGKFTTSNWKEVSGLIFGSGSLAWLIKSWLERRKEKSKSQDDDNDSGPFGFAKLLNSKQDQGKR